jgi:hypothetical protein
VILAHRHRQLLHPAAIEVTKTAVAIPSG